MPAPIAPKRFHSLTALGQALLMAGLIWSGPGLVRAAEAPAPAASAAEGASPVLNSNMDGNLFYQVLVSEIQARSGNVGTAYQIYLELARKHRNPELFKRAVEIALQARAGEETLAAAKAWRQALPQSREAAEAQVQILLALGRTTDLADALKSLIQLSPTPQQPLMLASLPRSLARLSDRKVAAQVIDEATQPWRQQRPPALAEAWVASGEGWLAAKDTNRAVDALKKARALQPQNLGAGLLAINLMDEVPATEDIVRQELARPDAPNLLRLAYARKLATSQRMSEAAQQLDTVVQAQPDQIGAWLTLAAVRLELHQPDQAEVALQHFLALKKQTRPADSAPSAGTPDQLQTAVDTADASEEQAYTLLAQVEEQRGNWQAALDWLQRVDNADSSLLIQTQRAKLMARQGKLAEGRALIRAMPESEPRDALTKLQAETQLLRDLDKWDEAHAVMAEANQRFPDDPDLLYEQAMIAEHLGKYDEMEKLLRHAIELKPDNANSYNALGYSLADRNVRLEEARTLIRKALDLRPGDPFITDSLGWLEFRSGRVSEALSLLRQAYDARPDPEIAAHLGEVLWSKGERDEAIKVWRRAQSRDAKNDALLDTIKRLQVQL